MTVEVDEAAVRQFIEIISAHVVELAKGAARPGVLQICCLSPLNEKLIPHRFRIDDVDGMVRTAVEAAKAGLNTYLEARTVRADLRGAERGKIDDTEFVFGLVVDSDNDKGKGGVITARPSLTVETSSGNYHYWYLLSQLVAARRAQQIGDAMRAATGADADTGVVTQCYRVAGTPNYPSKAKRARGRTTVEPTRIVEESGRLWDPDEFAAQTTARAAPAAAAIATPVSIAADEASLPDNLLEAIRNGGVSKGGAKRSGLFHHVIGELRKRRWSVEQIDALLEKYPNGVAAKYQGRLRDEIQRSYDKVDDGSGSAQAGPQTAAGSVGGGSSPPPPPASGMASGTGPGPAVGAPFVLPTIRIRSGQLPRVVKETEKAVLDSGVAIFARGGRLVYPVSESAPAANGGQTVMARLSEFMVDSFVEPVAEAAIFQRHSMRAKAWIDVDPPVQLVRMVLARERRWSFPRVAGVITTPTLRPDGSLLSVPGYDPRTELYLCLGLAMPTIPQAPTRDDARAALAVLKELFDEFSFKRRAPALDLAVALSGVLTALLRGSLPTAPINLVRADTPGTGKSYLVDVISTIATGRLCPVITAGRSAEETEKRIGAVLLAGSSIMSLDNLIHDLEGELLCQVAERPVVRIRPLGRSETVDCECHTAMWATGNNVGFKGDMVRRGLVCDLEARDAKPEMREFKRDAVGLAQADRGKYVAAALTIVRAYLAADAPRVCGPFGSYRDWSRMVRSPLVWLGEPDPVASLEASREEDPVLSNIREFFALWSIHMRLDYDYTTTRIAEIAVEDRSAPNNFNPPDLENFLLKVAAERGRPGVISSDRLGRWLTSISGRVVDGRRLVKGRDQSKVAVYRLINV
jgi:putative DNA primase/helicase